MTRASVLIACVAGLCTPGLPAQDAGDGRKDRVLAEQVARSIELYSTYTGTWPASLDDLTRKPAAGGFWPEGGFWIGALPKAVSWKEGRVVPTQLELPLAPRKSAQTADKGGSK